MSDDDPFLDLAGHTVYDVHATFTNPTDVLFSLVALAVPPETASMPMFINVPCGCYNHPTFGGLTGPPSAGQIESDPLAAYDTYWTLPGLNENLIANPNFVVDENGETGTTNYTESGLCSTGVLDGIIIGTIDQSCSEAQTSCNQSCGGDPDCLAACAAAFEDCLSEQPYAAGDDLTMQFARITSACGFAMHTCLVAALEGDYGSQATFCMDVDGDGPLIVGDYVIPSCQDGDACNFGEALFPPFGIDCDYSCCPGPGCCGEGTVWSNATQQCETLSLGNDCNFDHNDDGVINLPDLLAFLNVFDTLCPQ